MQDGIFDGAISTHNTKVFVNFVEVPVRSAKVERGMRDGHPVAKDLLNGSWCTEATIEWASPDDVTAGAPEPFGVGSWLPKDGDRVDIQTGEGTAFFGAGQWWTIHTGVIDETTGSFRNGTAKSRTVDDIEELGKSIHYGALLAHMTPWNDSLEPRRMGLQSTYMIDRIFRDTRGGAHGWYATPPRTWETVGAAPCNGSMWPEVGTLWSCHRLSDASSGPPWYRTDWGVAPADVYADTRLISPVEDVILTTGIHGAGSGSATLSAVDTNGDGFYVGFTDSTDEIDFGCTGYVGGRSWHVPRGGATRAAVRFKRLTTDSQTITLRLDDGREWTHDPGASAYPNGWAADRVILESNQVSLGWWVCEGEKPRSGRWATLEHTPTAHIRVGDIPWWKASRDLPWDYAGDWLAEQVDAECAAMWLDEAGHLQWAGRGVLDAQPVAATVTSELAVDDIQWESRRSSMARSAWVDALDPFVTAWSGTNVEVWSTDSVDVGADDEVVSKASVPGDEDWIAVDSSSTLITDWGYHPSGSQHSGTYYKAADGIQDGGGWAIAFTNTISSHGLREWRVTTTGFGNIPATHRIRTVKPQADDAFVRVDGGRDGLLLRARAKVTWSDVERSVTAGSVGPPRYSTDVGWRVQSIGPGHDAIGALLSFLKDVVSSTNPTVQGLTLEHDPRRQVGDKIRIEDPLVSGVWIELICGDITTDCGDFTDEINGRITDWGDLPVSLPSPSGWTQMTPPTDWNREKVD